MISFSLSDEQEIVRSSAEKFARNTLRPISRSLSASRGAREQRGFDDALLREIASLGLVQAVAAGVEEPGESHVMSTLALEAISAGDANAAIAIAAPLGFVRAVATQGSMAQQKALLPLFESNTHCAAAIAAAEPGLNVAGLGELKTVLTPLSGGHSLNGHKALVPFAERCSHFLVIARERADLRAIVVPADLAGVKIEAPRQVMGCASSEWSDVVFRDVVITPAMWLGEDKGCDVQKIVNGSRIACAAILAGISKSAYLDAADYARNRLVGGQVLATKQSVAVRLVDMFTDTESLSWMAWRAAGQVDRGMDATRSARLAHGRSVNVAGRVTDEALQIMSGHGYMAENLTESWYRNARTVASLELALGV